jgi:hypothetical protein
MAAANSKPSAAQLGKLETEMKTAFKEGRWEVVRKKADEIRKADPQNRTVERILQKTQDEEKSVLKKANAMKIKALEAKMDQSFKAGDLAAMTQAVEEVKKLDPANAKALKAEASIAKAKSILEAEIRKEKVRKLSAEVEFFANKADWGQAATKANELLSVEWDNSVAMKVLKKIAITKKATVASLITVQTPKVEKKLGFFARLFGKKDVAPAKASPAPVKEAPKAMPAPIAMKSEPSVLKPLAPVMSAPVILAKPVISAPIQAKPSAFGSLLAKKEEPKAAIAVVPSSVSKPAVSVEARPMAIQDAKKAEPAKAIPVKAEKKSGFFGGLFAKGAVAPTKALPVPAKETPKPVVVPSVVKPAIPALKPMAPAPVAAMAPAKDSVKAPAVGLSLVSRLAAAVDTKPKVETKPVAPSPSIFGSLLTRKEEPKPAVASPMVTPVVQPKVAPAPLFPFRPAVPVAPIAPVKPEVKPVSSVFAPVMAQTVAKPMDLQLKVEQKTVAKPESKAQEKGNIFTSLFGKEEVVEKPTASVLETIVAKTAPTKPESKRERAPEEHTGEAFLTFAGAFLRLAIVFIAISAAFLYVENMDQGNKVFGFFNNLSSMNLQNNASQLHAVALDIADKGDKVKNLNDEITKYQGGYKDEHKDTIQKIIDNRMDWTDILKKLSEVTESVYEKNAISQYVQYNNYTYNSESGQFTVSGTLSDPLGKNLTKLAELEQAFLNYPKDPQDPSDDRKPYFYGLQEFNAFAKTFNNSTGRYQSTFALTLYTKEQPKK